MADSQVKPLLVVIGETASGKSALALQLAQRFNGEIICADSTTVRRELNIGTAKPTLAEQQLIPHHLLNVIDPEEGFTAADFQRLAKQSINEISKRKKLPILVGGTGLYIDALLYDYSFRNKPHDPSLINLSVIELQRKVDSLAVELNVSDRSNPRRLIRAIETVGMRSSYKELRKNTLIIGLEGDRSEIKSRIIKRVDSMIKAGLEDEVKQLATHYDWDSPALKIIGYREWKEYVRRDKNLVQTRELIIKSTISLAKRQRTWSKRNKSIHWFTTPVKLEAIVDAVTTYLSA